MRKAHRKYVKLFVLCIVVSMTLGVLFVFTLWEGYFPVIKYIDTTFAKDYTHKAWENIQLGMSKEDVVFNLGLPLTDTNKSADIWWYSNDGKCSWGDFAWCAKIIEFSSNGLVSAKIDKWYND